MKEKPKVTNVGLMNMQLCIPKDWTDEQAIAFAQSEHPCGTEHGWQIEREGCSALDGSPERVDCEERDGYIHIMVEA